MESASPALSARELDMRLRALAVQGSWSEIAAAIGQLADPDGVLPSTAGIAYKAHRALGDEAAAEAWLVRALALAPANATLQRDLGALHQKRGDWAQATKCFQTAVTLSGDVAAYRGSLATAMFHSARYEEAALHYRAGLALDATRPHWWRGLARALMHLNEPGEAVQAYTRALELQDDAPTRMARDELLRLMRSGSRAASSAYYDAAFADSPKYARHGEASEYAPAWQAIAELLRERGSRSVLDLGCGPGQLAQYLGVHLPGMAYTGVDFSGIAVSRARQRCPAFLFEKRELPLRHFAGLPPFDTAVCTEVLEHVEADREILAALPAGTRVVATVPNYDAFGHLRLFADADEVRRRYGLLFDELQVQAVALSPQRTLWLMCGARTAAPLPANEPEALALGSIDLAASAVDCVLWSDGTRYAQDFLPQFGLPFVTVADSVRLHEPHVALRHDVDGSIDSAWAMAVVEHQLGIRSSYYLLHPDGLETPKNYFGQVSDGRLAIDPRLFDWAARLIDLGHEVGLHNDLITLALATRRQPGEFLEQIVEAFAKRGMTLVGSAAHDARLCRELGYSNHQIFAELRDAGTLTAYHDQSGFTERCGAPRVEQAGHTIDKFALRMDDFGLRYEANFVPREIFLSDSSAHWTLWHVGDPVKLDKFAPRERMQAMIADALRRKQARSGVQCLVHACHWSTLVHAHPQTLPAVRRRVKRQVVQAGTRAMVQRLAAFDNVIDAHSDERFEVYDQADGTRPQVSKLASSVTRFIDRLVAEAGEGPRDLLDLGCGQGDLLAGLARRLQARAAEGVTVRGIGVDRSPGAIVTSAGRYPDLRWAADPLEHFLAAHDELALDAQGRPLRYDLVLDKTGATFIDSYETACACFARIDALMRPGALYVYIASRYDYDETLSRQQFAGWPRDWMTLAADTWEPWLADDDAAPALRGHYKRVYRKKGGPLSARPGSTAASEERKA